MEVENMGPEMPEVFITPIGGQVQKINTPDGVVTLLKFMTPIGVVLTLKFQDEEKVRQLSASLVNNIEIARTLPQEG